MQLSCNPFSRKVGTFFFMLFTFLNTSFLSIDLTALLKKCRNVGVSAIVFSHISKLHLKRLKEVVSIEKTYESCKTLQITKLYLALKIRDLFLIFLPKKLSYLFISVYPGNLETHSSNYLQNCQESETLSLMPNQMSCYSFLHLLLY